MQVKGGAMQIKLHGLARVWILNVAIAGAAAAVYTTSLRDLPAYDETRIPGWALAACFFLTEAFVVHVHVRRESESFSLSELPLAMGLFFATPSDLVGAMVVGAGAALLFRRRQPAHKLAFNVSHFALEASLAALIFRSFAVPSSTLGAREAGAAFLALGSTMLGGVLIVMLAISLAGGRLPRATAGRVLTVGSIVVLTNASVGLLAVLLLRVSVVAAVLLLIPAITLFLAYRAYASQAQQRRSLELLYASTRKLQRSLDVRTTIEALLANTCEMFRAEVSWITLLPSDGEHAVRFSYRGGELTIAEPFALDPTEGVWARVVAEGQALLFPRPIANERLRGHFEAQGIRDVMAAPLHGDDGIVGTLCVGERLGDVSTFQADDLTMFETLANHASVAIQNAKLVSRLQEALARQTELNRMKDEFVATVSHELRTPLTSIQGFVKTMLRPDAEYPKDEMRDFLAVIDRQSSRLRKLIEDLLIVSRIESHPETPAAGLVSVGPLAREVVDEFRGREPHRPISVEFEGNSEIVSDEETLHRIIANLIDNALKYSPAGAPVFVRGRREGNGLVVSVEDHGRGIPAELRDRIFDRFFQIDQSMTRTAGGTGLGLYICRRLVSSIEGRVWLERSEPGVGSTFSLWAPSQTRPQDGSGARDRALAS